MLEIWNEYLRIFWANKKFLMIKESQFKTKGNVKIVITMIRKAVAAAFVLCEYYFWLKFIAPYHWYFILFLSLFRSSVMFLLIASNNNTTKLRTYQIGPLWSWATLLNVVTSAGHRLHKSSKPRILRSLEYLKCCRKKIWILSLPKK